MPRPTVARAARTLWSNLAVIALLLSIAANTYLYSQTHGLAASNHRRVADIQESRLASCRQTYEGIREVFRPFFPPAEQRSPKQRADLAKFNRIVDRLKRSCPSQVNATERSHP